MDFVYCHYYCFCHVIVVISCHMLSGVVDIKLPCYMLICYCNMLSGVIISNVLLVIMVVGFVSHLAIAWLFVRGRFVSLVR